MAFVVALTSTTEPAHARPAIDQSLVPRHCDNIAAEAGSVGLPARRHHTRGDPFERFNRAMFGVFTAMDRMLFRPVALAYQMVVPKVVRGGIRHVLSNAGEPIVFVNDLLQLKPKRAVRTLGRFTVNTTLGIAGLVDVAKTSDFKLPHHDNGFGNTLGRYGAGPGPYLYLPLIGPSDLRDIIGGSADAAMLPHSVGFPFDRSAYQMPHSVIVGVDQRALADGDLRALQNGAIDPYATLRSSFQQQRAATVAELRGHLGTGERALDDPLLDPEDYDPHSAAGAGPADGPTASASAPGTLTGSAQNNGTVNDASPPQ